MNAAPRREDVPRPPWGLWVFLTLLVWGLFAPDRGLYQDDVSVLAVVQEAWRTSGVAGLFAPMGGPTRRLLGLPTFLAWLTPEPVFALQLLTARRLHEYELPPGWVCFAAINPESADYQVTALDRLWNESAASSARVVR